MLIDKGADVNLPSKLYDLFRKFPIDFCCNKESLDILLQNGAYLHCPSTVKELQEFNVMETITKNTPPGAIAKYPFSLLAAGI
jgi:hypothetical protein